MENFDKEKDDEDLEIDFGKFTSFFKRKKKKEKEPVKIPESKPAKKESPKEEIESKEQTEEPIKEKAEDTEEDDEELSINAQKSKISGISENSEEEFSIDFSKIKNIFKKGKDSLKSEIEKESAEDISIDWKKTGIFFKKYSVLFLILIPIILSIHFRMYSADLPVTDDWAANTVYNHYKSQIQAQIDQEYPNLPDTNKQTLIENEFKQLLKQEKSAIEQQIKQISNQYKQEFKDGSGQTYLLAIDPYLWYGEARNYLNNNHFGTEIVDGKEINFLRNGRMGREMPSIKLLSYLEVFLFKFLHFFNKDTSLMYVCFIMPVILITLSTIFAFLITKRIAGNIGGLFAGIIVAINAALLSRTPAGFADTDPFNVLFPLMIAWAFLEAFEAKDKIKRYAYTGLTGLFMGLFSIAWMGWAFMFYFVLFVIAVYFTYQLIIYLKDKKQATLLKDTFFIGIIFFLSSAIFVTLFKDLNEFIVTLTNPLSFISIKAVAVSTIWPNVLTTVAEFNVIPLKAIMSQMGGKFLFFIAIIGILLTIVTKRDIHKKIDIKYAAFLTIWFIGTTYAFTKGTRFAILLVPAFAIAFGVACGITYKFISKWAVKEMHIPKHLSKIILIILLCLLLIAPLKSAKITAKNEMPSMNDAWYNSLLSIKENSTDAVITSWWDFGHWFVAISERRVTFDGADQGRRIHWVGKTLLTADEEEAIDILKMLNCGQEDSSYLLEEYLKENFKKETGNKEINVLDNTILDLKAVETLKEIIKQNKKTAEKTLIKQGLTKPQAKEILELTHCDNLIDQYYIASEDMLGKSGVWGHFGSWDFRKAAMYQAVKGKEHMEGIEILKTEFDLSEDEANDIYYEIQNNDADHWVSPWPGYAQTTLTGCSEDNNKVTCGNGLEFNLATEEAAFQTQQGIMHPKSISFINKKGKFELKEYKNNTIPYSVALIPNQGGYGSIMMDPKLAASMFTRLFFFDSHGLKHFKPFVHTQQITGGHIYIYKIDWNSNKEHVVEEFLKKEKTAITENGAGNESTL